MTREEQIAIIKEHIDYLEGLKKTADDLFDKEQADKDIESFKAAIQALEEQKTGHWIYICNSEVNGLKICECSYCHKRTYGSTVFCPNCGCRMVEPQESEDKG